MNERWWRRVVRLAVMLACGAGPLAAQAIRVRVLDAESTGPVPGALVSLLAADGRTTGEGLTNADGARLMAAPVAGAYRVRVRRIGFAPWVSEPAIVGARDTIALALRVPFARVTLSAVAVVADRKRCRRDEAGRLRSGELWEQIRTALLSAEATRADRLVRTRVRAFERAVTRGGVVRDSVIRDLGETGARPFQAAEPVELSRHGFVLTDTAASVVREGGTAVEQAARGMTYLAPDARVLLSEEFGGDHCFDLVPGADAAAGLVGLAFEPVADRSLPEVQGTLWVDPASLELRRLEYDYVNVDLPAGARGVGGRIDFERLPSGAWIERSWVIRMPRLRESLTGRGKLVLAGFLDAGGEAELVGGGAEPRARPASVRSPDARAGTRDAPSTALRLAGVVFDSLLGRPLAGATVRLADADSAAVRAATTDSAGRFVLERVPPGIHELSWSHPALDSLGILGILRRPGREVEVEADSAPPVLLATPSLRTIERGQCDDSAVVAAGVVRGAESGRPLAGATVRLSWLESGTTPNGGFRAALRTVDAPTDGAGGWMACVAGGVLASATARAGRAAGGPVDVRPGTRGIAVVDLFLDDSLAGLPSAGDASPPAGGRARIAGVVRDAQDRPLAGAEVAVPETGAATRTDGQGRYSLGTLPAGSQTVEIRHLGYGVERRTARLRNDATTSLDATLAPVTRLAAVSVVASGQRARLRAEFETRRRAGFGYGVGPAQIDSAKGATVETLLGGMPNLIFDHVRGDRPLIDPDTRDVTPPGGLIIKFASMHGFHGPCAANVYLDGQPITADDLRRLDIREIAAIEVFSRVSEAPPKYVPLRDGCGVVLVWLRGPGWK